MNKLTITDKVFVPVSVKDELIPTGELKSVSFNNGIRYSYEAVGKGWNPDELQYTHWLKEETNKYVLSKEEIEKVIRDAWDAARLEKQIGKNVFEYKFDKEQYINSIL
jgi:hypothetical protein